MTGEGSDSSATTHDLVETGGTAKPYSDDTIFGVSSLRSSQKHPETLYLALSET